MTHCRYYQIANLTVQVESDLPIIASTFQPNFSKFAVDGPGEDTLVIRHHFMNTDLPTMDLGEQVYINAPWAIHRRGDSWIYRLFPLLGDTQDVIAVAITNGDHTHTNIYHADANAFHKGQLHSLTLLNNDDFLLARVLADRQGCFVHSSGAILNGQGLLFVGHSGAGKSTLVKLLEGHVEVLCDDRNIIRRWPEGFLVHGTWSHGEWPVVSAESAPLRAILFLEKASQTRLQPLEGRHQAVRMLLPCVIRHYATSDWWEKTLGLVEKVVGEVPCYILHFNKGGSVLNIMESLV